MHRGLERAGKVRQIQLNAGLPGSLLCKTSSSEGLTWELSSTGFSYFMGWTVLSSLCLRGKLIFTLKNAKWWFFLSWAWDVLLDGKPLPCSQHIGISADNGLFLSSWVFTKVANSSKSTVVPSTLLEYVYFKIIFKVFFPMYLVRHVENTYHVSHSSSISWMLCLNCKIFVRIKKKKVPGTGKQRSDAGSNSPCRYIGTSQWPVILPHFS